MAQPHSTNNYTISKGVFSIAEWSGGSIGTYKDIGNVTGAEVEPTVERLPHYSSRTAARLKDKNPVISTEYTLRMTLDELASGNLKKYLMGTLTGGNVIAVMQDLNKEYAVRLTEDNAAGPNKIWNFWKMTLGPAGPMQLIGDGTAWAVMEIQGDGLADSAGHPTSPYITVTYATTTTTTTTS